MCLLQSWFQIHRWITLHVSSTLTCFTSWWETLSEFTFALPFLDDLILYVIAAGDPTHQCVHMCTAGSVNLVWLRFSVSPGLWRVILQLGSLFGPVGEYCHRLRPSPSSSPDYCGSSGSDPTHVYHRLYTHIHINAVGTQIKPFLIYLCVFRWGVYGSGQHRFRGGGANVSALQHTEETPGRVSTHTLVIKSYSKSEILSSQKTWMRTDAEYGFCIGHICLWYRNKYTPKIIIAIVQIRAQKHKTQNIQSSRWIYYANLTLLFLVSYLMSPLGGSCFTALKSACCPSSDLLPSSSIIWTPPLLLLICWVIANIQ